MESFLQIAPHSLAIVLSRVAGEARGAVGVSESDELPRHHTGYEIFADFKAENTQQHVWNQRITEAVSETFFLGWIDEHVLLIQGKEDHLEVLREGWMRRSLNPPRGFTIKYLGKVKPSLLAGAPFLSLSMCEAYQCLEFIHTGSMVTCVYVTVCVPIDAMRHYQATY